MQYAPGWVFALPYGRYQNQFGDRFASKEPGVDMPNVVFNARVRERLDLYFEALFRKLGSDWDYVRLGCCKFGELNYPPPGFGGRINCYWAFDDLAQGRAPGLAPGIAPAPVPGWIPGTKASHHENARLFANWYLDCLKNYQEWQIASVRRWYRGELCMLYGSWGLRPGQLETAIAEDLSGTTPAELNGEIQQGYDWARMVGALADPRAIVYCTWIDGTLSNRDICDDASKDPTRWSPVHWQSVLARGNPLHLRVWGENTGGNTAQTMRLTFERIRRFDLMGVMWAFEGELYAEPNPKGWATAPDFAKHIGLAP